MSSVFSARPPAPSRCATCARITASESDGGADVASMACARQFDLCTAGDGDGAPDRGHLSRGGADSHSLWGAKAIAVLAAINRMNVRIAAYHSSALRLQWAVQWLRIAPRSTVVVAATHGLLEGMVSRSIARNCRTRSLALAFLLRRACKLAACTGKTLASSKKRRSSRSRQPRHLWNG